MSNLPHQNSVLIFAKAFLFVGVGALLSCSGGHLEEERTPTIAGPTAGAISTAEVPHLTQFTPADEHFTYAAFSSRDVGVSLEYPAFLKSREVISGVRIGNSPQATTIYFESPRHGLLITFQAVDDPLLAALDDWFPPTTDLLRKLVVSDLNSLALEKNSENDRDIATSAAAGVLSEISGYPAMTFEFATEDSKKGKLYLLGAEVISPVRSFSLLCLSVDDTDSPYYFSKTDAEMVWSHLLESLVISHP